MKNLRVLNSDITAGKNSKSNRKSIVVRKLKHYSAKLSRRLAKYEMVEHRIGS